MMKLSDFGHKGLWWIESGSAVIAAALVPLGAKIMGTGIDLAPITSLFGPLYSALIGGSMAFCAALAYLVPLLPLFYFTTQILEWFCATVGLTVMAPFWVLSHFTMRGDGFTGGAGEAGYALLLRIFFQPFIIVVGYFISMAMFELLGGFVIKEIIQAFNIGTAGSTVGIVGLLAFLATVTIVVGTVIHYSFGMMARLTSSVTHMLDLGEHHGGSEEAKQAHSGVMAVVGKVQAMGNIRVGSPKKGKKDEGGSIGPGSEVG
jgi:conjugal transfer/type IV secretion protein DotA/TraY